MLGTSCLTCPTSNFEVNKCELGKHDKFKYRIRYLNTFTVKYKMCLIVKIDVLTNLNIFLFISTAF